LDVVEAVLARRDVVFVYGGDGSYRGALQQAIDGRGLSQVVSIQGLVTDKVAFFVDIDVHLSIAVGADVGLASLEAASSGTPSLAIQLRNDHPGLGEAIPSSRDPDELANLLVALIDSEQERKELGKQQAQYVRSERSIDSMGQSYMEVYREALAAADPAGH